MRETRWPLALSRQRVLLYGGFLIVLCLLQVRFVIAQQYGDWSAFWAAGATAGTPDLLDAHRHAIWQHGHHVPTTIFPYLPGAAWFLVPLKPLSLSAGYTVNFCVMALAAVGAAMPVARVYAMRREFAIMLTFAWAPVIAALSTGQNAPLVLLLFVCGLWGLATESWLVTGLAAGAMLYKPLYALPFIIVLMMQRNWRAIGVVCMCGIAWYALSVLATAGDWNWPQHYVAAIRSYALEDARGNANKAISIPQLLMRLHVAALAAYACGTALFAGALLLIYRMPKVQAASVAMLAWLALGPHTLPYDLALMLPAIFCFMNTASEPLRTRVIAGMYLSAPLWLLSGVLRFDVLAVLCAGFLILLLALDRAGAKGTDTSLALNAAL